MPWGQHYKIIFFRNFFIEYAFMLDPMLDLSSTRGWLPKRSRAKARRSVRFSNRISPIPSLQLLHLITGAWTCMEQGKSASNRKRLRPVMCLCLCFVLIFFYEAARRTLTVSQIEIYCSTKAFSHEKNDILWRCDFEAFTVKYLFGEAAPKEINNKGFSISSTFCNAGSWNKVLM